MLFGSVPTDRNGMPRSNQRMSNFKPIPVMKPSYAVLFLAPVFLLFMCLGCASENRSNGPGPQCDCPYVQPAFAQLQPNTKIITETTNASQQQVRKWRDLQLELGLELNEPLKDGNLGLARLAGKAVIPYFNDGKERFYQIITVENGQIDKFQQYMLQVCELYYRYYVLNDCKPGEADKAAFLKEERMLKEKLLGWRDAQQSIRAINNRPPPPAPPPQRLELLLMHPGSMEFPKVEVSPNSVTCSPGAYSTTLVLHPGLYTAILTDLKTGSRWHASFDAGEKIIQEQRFIPLNN